MTPRRRFRVDKRPSAIVDLTECADYLEEQRPGTADRFLAAAEAMFDRLAWMPRIGRAVPTRRRDLGELRMISASRFRRYLILYTVEPNSIEVLRVVHGSRDLGAILKTLP